MKTRVVAYSRVSSEHDDQINSLKNQRQHWEEYIKSNNEWEYAGMYWDEGITGTSTKKRDGFLNMMQDAKLGKFDLVITKSVTRWARNIVDSIQYARDLKKIGVAVYFSSDNIHTINDADAELRLSIMSTLAQDESRRISENVKFGHKRAMKNGVVYGANRVWGYDIKDKQLHVNEKEADIIRHIFNWYVFDNESLHGIVKRLRDELGITKGKLGGKIDHSTIKRIIENEKYCGDLKQRKYYTEDFLEQKQRKNNGKHQFITIENHHEPIIHKDIWLKAQNILKERAVKSNRGVGYSRHSWGGKLICGVCDDKLRRKVLKNADGSDRPIWICTTAHDKGKNGCSNTSYIREEVLEDATKVVIEKLKEKKNKDSLLQSLNKILENLTENSDTKTKLNKIEKQIEVIRKKRDKLLELYMESNLSKDDFTQQNDTLNNKEINLNNQLNDIKTHEDYIRKMITSTDKFYDMLVDEYDNVKDVEDFVEDYITSVQKYKERLIFNLSLVDPIEICLSKYPKRVYNGVYTTIMDTKVLYLIERGAVRYYESLDIELKLAI